ncbi:hypothetical protein HME9304_01821 [Flagellimonas maritima]|uniref:Uncharacterized protein n=1 Tax=Flagellimonas maritima TaxID=1383885 RepID=A0A2Z4LSL5_9FLAO|nr:hypothetical protein [Allomuricauda aurantiaca]AWX44816.1 hypothetical protein HME9304_01821 [Allomuricauda aurantiaca]
MGKRVSIIDRYGVLEHELELTWKIYEFALKAYHHADYLFINAGEKEMKIIAKSNSLRYLRVVCARTCVLEISKLITKGQNNHYSFWNLVQRIRNERFVGNIKVTNKVLSEIENILEKNGANINKFIVIRDKLIAHDDFDNYQIPRPILGDLLPILEMTYNILCKLCVVQYDKVCPPEPKNLGGMDIEFILNFEGKV